jgi:hypothetical protein
MTAPTTHSVSDPRLTIPCRAMSRSIRSARSESTHAWMSLLSGDRRGGLGRPCRDLYRAHSFRLAALCSLIIRLVAELSINILTGYPVLCHNVYRVSTPVETDRENNLPVS